MSARRVSSSQSRSGGPAAEPGETEEQREPYCGAQGHRAHALDRDRTACRIQPGDRCEHDEIEREDRGRRAPAVRQAAPREDAGGHVRHAHYEVVDQQRLEHDVSRVGTEENARARDDRRETEEQRNEDEEETDGSHRLALHRVHAYLRGAPRRSYLRQYWNSSSCTSRSSSATRICSRSWTSATALL